ncbi:MAG: 30S ribosomal protein S1 [Thermoguttaceae bacterium]|nr:30S ribosomal protein S1 [Thermoguttaceae bacterium]
MERFGWTKNPLGILVVVNRNLISGLDLNEQDWDDEIQQVLGGGDFGQKIVEGKEITPNEIIEGKIVRIEKEFVIVDVGYKSEGQIPISEWEEGEEAPAAGQTIKVLVEELEDTMTGEEAARNMILLSKRKAAKIEAWVKMMEKIKEGETITGTVTKKIKGGLLVDIGVNVFLPASQVDVRRPGDIGEYIGKPIECLILKIDEARRNIVVSRRALIEAQRAERKNALLNELEEGQIRKGVIKNIADFGAFIDLGGIDGLLHITDMSWGRVTDPRDVVSIDQEIEVVVLQIDREKEKISLGLKQKTPSPWENISEKYPIGSRVTGTVVNVMNYGAFVKLEDGIEGLVHISEMSWTKRINHPSDILSVGDSVEVIVLGINKDKQEISLGIKQTQPNPWESVEEKYPIGSTVTGTVRNLTNYGAFIEIEEGIDGLLHISDMSWVRKVTHPNEVVAKGQKIECQVLSVDKKSHRIALGLKQLQEDPWVSRIPEKYQAGQIVTGKVTKVTNFGVFVSLEDNLEGLLHISELANHKVEDPLEVVKVGDDIEVKVLRVDTDERKIGLSRKRAEWTEEEEAAEAAEEQASAAAAQTVNPDTLKGGMGSGSGPLFSFPVNEEEKTDEN